MARESMIKGLRESEIATCSGLTLKLVCSSGKIGDMFVGKELIVIGR